jgi:hypothetical protein
VAIGIFSFSVLLLTRLDFIINNVLYNFGLNFSQAWHQEYSLLYFLTYQLVIFTLLAYTKILKLFTLFQFFILTSTHDLVYFGLWQGSFPSHEWTWMPYYSIFGFWDTTNQILLSASSLSAIMILFQFGRIQVWIQSSSIAKHLSRKDVKPLQQ